MEAKERGKHQDCVLACSIENKLEGEPNHFTFRMHFNEIRHRDDLTPHSFRHGFKTAARLAVADELVTERLLGHHAWSAISMLYGKNPEELMLREAEKICLVISEWIG